MTLETLETRRLRRSTGAGVSEALAASSDGGTCRRSRSGGATAEWRTFAGQFGEMMRRFKQPERERDKALVVATREARRKNKINQWMDRRKTGYPDSYSLTLTLEAPVSPVKD